MLRLAPLSELHCFLLLGPFSQPDPQLGQPAVEVLAGDSEEPACSDRVAAEAPHVVEQVFALEAVFQLTEGAPGEEIMGKDRLGSAFSTRGQHDPPGDPPGVLEA